MMRAQRQAEESPVLTSAPFSRQFLLRISRQHLPANPDQNSGCHHDLADHQARQTDRLQQLYELARRFQ